MVRTGRSEPTICVHQRRDGEVAGDGDQKDQRGEQREEEVVRELGGEAEAVVLEDGVDERASEDLSPGQADAELA